MCCDLPYSWDHTDVLALAWRRGWLGAWVTCVRVVFPCSCPGSGQLCSPPGHFPGPSWANLCSRRDKHQLSSARFCCQSNRQICLSQKEQEYPLLVSTSEGLWILLGPCGSRPLWGPWWVLDNFGFTSILFLFSFLSIFCESSGHFSGWVAFPWGKEICLFPFLCDRRDCSRFQATGKYKNSSMGTLSNLSITVVWGCRKCRQGCYSTRSCLWLCHSCASFSCAKALTGGWCRKRH